METRRIWSSAGTLNKLMVFWIKNEETIQAQQENRNQQEFERGLCLTLPISFNKDEEDLLKSHPISCRYFYYQMTALCYPLHIEPYREQFRKAWRKRQMIETVLFSGKWNAGYILGSLLVNLCWLILPSNDLPKVRRWYCLDHVRYRTAMLLLA